MSSAVARARILFDKEPAARPVVSSGIPDKTPPGNLNPLSPFVIVAGAVSMGLALAMGLPFLFLIPVIMEILRRGAHRRSLSKQAQAFEADYPVFLSNLSSAVKTGVDPLLAFTGSGEALDEKSILRRELNSFREHIDSGAAEEDAVLRFAHGIQHPDLRLFRTAYILARREGSSLSECLIRLAKVTRQRQSFRRKSKAAVAMQRLSAFGIAGSALTIALLQQVTNPEALKTAINHPAGGKLLLLGFALIITGLVWMYRLTAPKV